MQPTPEPKMPIAQWAGLGLMALAWVLGFGLYYLRYAADMPRIVYAPGGGVISDGAHHASPLLLIVASVLIFLSGLAVFLVDRFGPTAKAARKASPLDLKRRGTERTRDTSSAAQALYSRYRRQQEQ